MHFSPFNVPIKIIILIRTSDKLNSNLCVYIYVYTYARTQNTIGRIM